MRELRKSKSGSKELRGKNENAFDLTKRRPRQGWRKAFRAGAVRDQDEFLMESIGPNKFDREEWHW